MSRIIQRPNKLAVARPLIPNQWTVPASKDGPRNLPPVAHQPKTPPPLQK